MSDGGATVVVKILETPVLREVLALYAWGCCLLYSIEQQNWLGLILIFLAGLIVAAGFWAYYNRRRSDSGTGLKLLAIVTLIVLLFPLLIVAWRRRKHA